MESEVSKIRAEISTIKAERERMSALEMSAFYMREIAGPSEPGEDKQRIWSRVLAFLQRHSRLAWTYNRVRDIWNKEPRARVSGDEFLELQRIAADRNEQQRDQLEARLEAIEARLNSIDPDFHRESLNSLRRSVSAMGRSDTSLDQ